MALLWGGVIPRNRNGSEKSLAEVVRFHTLFPVALAPPEVKCMSAATTTSGLREGRIAVEADFAYSL
jgi:hypothetical protein